MHTKRLKFIITRDKASEHSNENVTNEFWENEDYHAYVEKHGMHFNDKLAKWASSKMENANGVVHSWSVTEVKSAFKAMGHSIPEKATFGDATYAANMYYADIVGTDFKETDALKIASLILTDPDGYEGMLFNRFTADIMQQNIDVPWKELM